MIFVHKLYTKYMKYKKCKKYRKYMLMSSPGSELKMHRMTHM
jgi:hypothetical protein